MKKKVILLFLLIFALSNLAVFADSNVKKINENTIEKAYEYVADGKNKTDKSIKKEIQYDGEKYSIKDIKYNNKPLEVKEKVKVKNKEEYLKSIEKVINGKKYTFKAKNVKWDDKTDKIFLTESIEYQNRGDIKNQIDKDGYTLKLENTVNKEKSESFNAPAVFYSYEKNTNDYIFEGKIVHIENTPIWNGYQGDIKEYLGINGNDYRVSGGTFTSENTLIDESTNLYQRTAIYNGVKTVPYFLATYTYTGDDKTKEYEGGVTYVADGYYKTTANVTYAVSDSLLIKFLKYGVGILILGTAIAVVIFLLKKKTEKQDKEI